ncbi:uncharacterized protein LOC112185112 [Rosa chinensis]|nr:uncharacterized protein LOC112185112 [Rosa chinensis]
MMVVDGCLVIEFMLGRTYSKILRNDPLSQSSWMRTPLISDLFLRENQLPWLVLDCLFQYLVKENADDEPVGKHKFLSELTLKFCQLHTMRFLKPIDGASEIRHLLDHIRIGIVGPEKLTFSSRRYLVPSVTELRQIGVIFKRGDMSACHTLNIAFHNGVMEIPEICIGNN